jgi:hypothetical protein
MPMRSWLRHRRKLKGSIHEEVIEFFNLSRPSNCTMALDLTLPLMHGRKCFWGVKYGRHVRLTTSPQSANRLPKKRETIDIPHSYWPPRLITGRTLLIFSDLTEMKGP